MTEKNTAASNTFATIQDNTNPDNPALNQQS